MSPEAGGTPATLTAAIGRYPHTAALWSGAAASPLLRLDLAAVSPISRAFAPMVQDGRYDVAELAIGTFLQARALGKPLVLLPITLAARYQEAALLCRTDSAIGGPADLAGARIGVRAYAQTTALWLRGILADRYGLPPDAMRWMTFEGAHVAEYRDPPWSVRAPADADLLQMLRTGALDAAIVGNDVPDDPGLRTVFADPAQAGAAFWATHGCIPVNHLVAVRQEIAGQPALVVALLRLFAAARAGADPVALPFGCTALAPALRLALRYAGSQGLLARPLTLDALWDGLPDAARHDLRWIEDAS